MIRWAFLVLVAAVPYPNLLAQPYINYRGVVNAASFAPPGVPAGSIARGSLLSIFGRGLGPAQPSQSTQYPLQTQFAGVSVRITQGNVSLDAYPIYVSPGLVSAILPSNTPLGKVALRVTFNGQQSNAGIINVVSSAVGLFAVNSGGFGPGIVQNFTSPTVIDLNTPRATAKPGQALILWATGLGAIQGPDNVKPPVGDLPGPVDVFVGGQLANKLYAGRSSEFAAVDQINFFVPANAPAGCYVPVQVRTGGVMVSNAVTIAIERDGNPCTDTFNPASDAMRSASRRALVIAERVDSLLDQEVKSPESTIRDSISSVFAGGSPSEIFFNPGLSLPPVGTCTAFTDTRENVARDPAIGTRYLDAGAELTLAGPGGSSTQLTGFAGNYSARPPLAPGQYTLRGTGGTDLAGFSTGFNMASPVNWTNRLATNTISPQSPLTINWSGAGASDLIVIRVSSADTSSNSVGRFLCTADAAAGSFTVPSYLIQFLPPTPEFTVSPSAAVGVGLLNIRAPAKITAPTLDAGYVVAVSFQVKGVTVQ